MGRLTDGIRLLFGAAPANPKRRRRPVVIVEGFDDGDRSALGSMDRPLLARRLIDTSVPPAAPGRRGRGR
ncbi:MAG TPA: hypothetical protein VKU19_14910 [Bryobacteraceae bacterium]|nr:hypothetical protein [Bryobacteraceae bacterium]